MRQIRTGVFETNSSSTHSICIATNPKALYKPRKLVFYQRNFGWEFASYYDALEKASYLYTAMLELYSEEEVEDRKKIISNWLEEEGVSCDFNIPGEGPYGFLVGIDHYTETKPFVDAVLSSKTRLMNYLFSDDSFILTGNDNVWDTEEENVDIHVGYDHEEYYKGN